MRLLTGSGLAKAAPASGAVLLGAALVAASVLVGCDGSAPPRASASAQSGGAAQHGGAPQGSGAVPVAGGAPAASPAPVAAGNSSSASRGTPAPLTRGAQARPARAGTAGRKPRAVPASVPAGPAATGPRSRSSVQAAAVTFDGAFFSDKPAATWELLTARAKRLIPRGTWVQVHDGCQPDSAATARTVASVTVFGNTAIVTETAAAGSARQRDSYVLAYENGRWRYSPDSLGLYHHGSVSADVAAAKAAGFCGGSKVY